MTPIARMMLCAAAAFLPLAVPAQDFPNKTIRIVVPFAPGGGSDAITRMLAEKMSGDLKTSVVVENKPGASGIIGTDSVFKSAPDGYTLLVANGAITSNPWLYKLPYDTAKLTPVALMSIAPQLLAAHPSAPFKNFKEMIAYGKANPGKLTIATAGAGQLSHLAVELLEKSAGITVTKVHYKGSGNALADLLGGQIHASFGTAPGLIPHVKAGKVIAIATSGAKRIPQLPDTPSIGETLAGYDLVNWFGVFAPPATPKAVVDRLYQSISRAMAQPSFVDKLASDGFEPRELSPEKFDKMFRSELVYWQKFVEENRIKVD
ncbi:MAG: tripartite tricarboxylate transporter substrate binding protein [Betaproteobacteria bacterium]|nr:tripartite tricarboxylate transporter substrate binding protein [Betaproteobacteria bacterium]